MTLKYSVTVNTGRLNAIESGTPATPTLRIYKGTEPAVGAAATATDLLVKIPLGADWLGVPSGVAPNLKVDKVGTWSAAAAGAGAPGTATWFRIGATGADETVVGHVQGSCGQGSGDMSFDNATIASGQTVTVNTFSITAGNQS
jgi:polyisoprenoid-binding protein YceI